ncbi:hypothetical protein D3C73_1627370 [compost metagenome]
MIGSGMRLTIKNVSHPLIDTFASQLSFYGNGSVERWRQTQTEIARIRFLRRATELGARIQIIGDGLFEGCSKLPY